MPPIVIVSGPIGAGKSAVARELVASSPGPAAHVEGDVFWSFIAKAAKDRKRGEDFAMIMRAMTASARHFERDGYEVILDFSIPPWYLDAVRKVLQDPPFEYVVLRPSEAVCAARAAARREGAIADYATVRGLYAAFDGAQRFTIHDDESEPATLAERIRDELGTGKFRV
jgi:predicted kinase